METQEFKFDVAIVDALNKWVLGNVHLSQGLRYPERFVEWNLDELTFNLNVVAEEYYTKFIMQSFANYCHNLIAASEKPMTEFLTAYNLPVVNLKMKFVYFGIVMSKDVRLHPLKRTYPILKISKR